jgi:hypothetical protein
MNIELNCVINLKQAFVIVCCVPSKARECRSMASNLIVGVFAVTVCSVSLLPGSRAAELGSLDPSKCNDVGGLGKACADVPPTLSFSADRLNALKKALPPSDDEVKLAKKMEPTIGTLDRSKCNNSGGLGIGCADVPTRLYLSNAEFKAATGH